MMQIGQVIAKISNRILPFIGPSKVRFNRVWPSINKIEGWLVEGQEEWLFRTAGSLPAGARVVEIGGFKGRSTVSLAFGILGSRKQVFTIDMFKGGYKDVENRGDLREAFDKGFFSEWRLNIDQNGLTDYVTPLIGNSRDIAKIWSAPIHMLFIDGSHLFEDVLADFENFYPHVVPGGVIGIHDVCETWEGCYRAWNEQIKKRLKNTSAVSTLAYGIKP